MLNIKISRKFFLQLRNKQLNDLKETVHKNLSAISLIPMNCSKFETFGTKELIRLNGLPIAVCV